VSAKTKSSSLKGLLSGFLTRQRFKAVFPYIRGDILDVGCGYGLLVPLLPPGTTYVGVDSGPEILQYLRRTYPGHEFYQLDLDKDVFQLGQCFDTILMLAVIEHLAQPQKVLCQVVEHLKPDGRLLLTTPSPFGDQIHRIGARVGLFSQFAADDHETIFNQASLQKLLENCGIQIDSYRRFLYGGNQLFVCSHRIS
jgi:2-polyprenyl-3-methyl-5-hydroxy-6-metoxy-1,4-benzoquinol methylase